MMQQKTKIIEKYFIHFFYVGAFLLAVFSVIGYFVWDKYHIAAQADARKARIVRCTINASQIYTEAWATACIDNAKRTRSDLQACINKAEKIAQYISGGYNYKNLLETYVANCKETYGNADSSPNCLLPKGVADGLNGGLQKEEKMCALTA